jgi:hypothetical protein
MSFGKLFHNFVPLYKNERAQQPSYKVGHLVHLSFLCYGRVSPIGMKIYLIGMMELNLLNT